MWGGGRQQRQVSTGSRSVVSRRSQQEWCQQKLCTSDATRSVRQSGSSYSKSVATCQSDSRDLIPQQPHTHPKICTPPPPQNKHPHLHLLSHLEHTLQDAATSHTTPQLIHLTAWLVHIKGPVEGAVFGGVCWSSSTVSPDSLNKSTHTLNFCSPPECTPPKSYHHPPAAKTHPLT